MSRRLGRPAKKKDVPRDDHLEFGHAEHARQQVNRRVRSPKKRKVKEEQEYQRTNKELNNEEDDDLLFDQITFDDTMVDDIPTESACLPTTAFVDTEKNSPFDAPDNIDLSDSWLQEFMSSQPSDLTQDRNLLDALGLGNNNDSEFSSISTGSKDHHCSYKAIEMSSDVQDHVPLGAYYTTGNNFVAYSEPVMESMQGATEAISPYADYAKKDLLSWPEPLSSVVENGSARLLVANEQANFIPPTKGPRQDHDYAPSAENPRLVAGFTPPQYQCQCHERTARDLMCVNISASHTWPTVTIESILSCQQILHQLADSILRCAICCKSRVNLLMIVVVSIDSLITTLETITSVDSSGTDGFSNEQHGQRFRDWGHDIPNDASNRRYKSASFYFKAQVEACPLSVGGFPVPPEEKLSFIKQVLHDRLCGLSNIISRIQFCTREMLAVPASQGRLQMIVETDRRLQLVMTKMRTPVRR
ncbi:hypothetical protein BDV25DRAFT_139171 [Aspergillus avenaceus]|uniref:AflR-like C6 transcription factor n=1 Tax=Aspergillus avenaceus TaxID=36643 RepID=A0A5N6TYF8_ASPAV|nr:hypothetical protein BDV25DRAFT_139171 [Aspergillus avenaceus]